MRYNKHQERGKQIETYKNKVEMTRRKRNKELAKTKYVDEEEAEMKNNLAVHTAPR